MFLRPKRVKRSHNKSRSGCTNCKRRRVKCDEVRPGCGTCERFGIPCSYPTVTHSDLDPLAADSAIQSEARRKRSSPSLKNRGPGRPRNSWTAGLLQGKQSIGPDLGSFLVNSSHALTSDLNLSQAELLHHFIICTGPGIAGSDDVEDPIALFWARNAPRIGIAHPHVLSLCLSLAAYHLAHLGRTVEAGMPPYLSLAEHHFSTGLTQANEAFSIISRSNCGSLYVSTVLICFCSLAAGPTNPADLLVCNIGDSAPSQWLVRARGTRVLCDLYDSKDLFSGLTEPLSPAGALSEDPRPTYLCEGFERLDWIGHVQRLGCVINSHKSADANLYLKSFEMLSAIYDATFGDETGQMKGRARYKMIFIWLYMMEDAFVACVQRMDAVALLLLAYYAPLLKSMHRCWGLSGWPEHILDVLKPLVKGEHAELLQWPVEAVKSM